jgi:sugar O-acyltransferase (sialic acid O-acetyltransferase NeuD family)
LKTQSPILILCAGGMGTAAAEAIRAKGASAAFLDDFAPKGSSVTGFPVLGPLFLLPELLKEYSFVCAASGNAAFRKALLTYAQKLGFSAPPVIHPSAIVSPYAALGSGCFVLAGAYVGPLALIGRGCIVNTGATVEHHCRAGAFSHICPGAAMLGRSKAGNNATVGANATLLPGVTVGDAAVVGSGSVVTQNVEAGATVVGAPAKRIRS